jgi:hypothetical protein
MMWKLCSNQAATVTNKYHHIYDSNEKIKRQVITGKFQNVITTKYINRKEQLEVCRLNAN